MLQISKKDASEICPKTVAKNDLNMEPIWMPNGAKMEATRHPEINVFFDGFPHAFGNIGGTAGGAATGARVSHFLQPTPQGGAILSKITVQKQAKSIA